MFQGLILVAVVVAAIFGGSYYLARKRGLVQPVTSEETGKGHISLVTEAFAYIGTVLVLAGGGVAIRQRWQDISNWGYVWIFTGAAILFLAVGAVARVARDPAFQRLVGVVWFVSVGGVAGAVGFATHDVYGYSGGATTVSIGVATTLYAGTLWLLRRRAFQNVALFAGLIVAICGVIVTLSGDRPPALALTFALWGLGLVWAILGWSRYIEPLWVATPIGVALALLAPSFAVDQHGWILSVGIATAAVTMAASVVLRFTVFLAFGTLAMFGYVTSTVVRYFRESLGVPAALAITGVLILGLAAVSTRLVRATRPTKPASPQGDESGHEPIQKAS